MKNTNRSQSNNSGKRATLEGIAELRSQLRKRLLALNFHAFARCIVLLLEKMGYQEVRLSGRTDWKGRNRHGGYEAEATIPGVLGKRRVIIALKQFDNLPVHQRNIDELRGVCLRVGASEALLLTTGSIAPTVRRWQDLRPEPLLAPVRLMDGEMLIDKLIEHKVGIWTERGEAGKQDTFGLDDGFFQQLEHSHLGNSREDCHKSGPETTGSQVRLTISIEPLSQLPVAS